MGNQKISRNKWQWNMATQNLWEAANAVLRGRLIAIHKKQEKTLNRQPNFTPKTTGKKRTKTPQN